MGFSDWILSELFLRRAQGGHNAVYFDFLWTFADGLSFEGFRRITFGGVLFLCPAFVAEFGAAGFWCSFCGPSAVNLRQRALADGFRRSFFYAAGFLRQAFTAAFRRLISDAGFQRQTFGCSGPGRQLAAAVTDISRHLDGRRSVGAYTDVGIHITQYT